MLVDGCRRRGQGCLCSSPQSVQLWRSICALAIPGDPVKDQAGFRNKYARRFRGENHDGGIRAVLLEAAAAVSGGGFQGALSDPVSMTGVFRRESAAFESIMPQAARPASTPLTTPTCSSARDSARAPPAGTSTWAPRRAPHAAHVPKAYDHPSLPFGAASDLADWQVAGGGLHLDL